MDDSLPIELHFQDDFTGQQIEVRHDGKVIEAFAARTRYQTGLAHIVKLRAPVGARIDITVDGGRPHPLQTVQGVIDYAVRLTPGGLTVQPSPDRLTYL